MSYFVYDSVNRCSKAPGNLITRKIAEAVSREPFNSVDPLFYLSSFQIPFAEKPRCLVTATGVFSCPHNGICKKQDQPKAGPVMPLTGLEPVQCRHRGILSRYLFLEVSAPNWTILDFSAPTKGAIYDKIRYYPISSDTNRQPSIFFLLPRFPLVLQYFLQLGGMLEG